jgi:hypothetical protein
MTARAGRHRRKLDDELTRTDVTPNVDVVHRILEDTVNREIAGIAGFLGGASYVVLSKQRRPSDRTEELAGHIDVYAFPVGPIDGRRYSMQRAPAGVKDQR